MATKINNKINTNNAAQPSVAHRMANRFDAAAAKAREDVKRPLAQSRVKQTGLVAGLVGTGVGIGLFLG